VEVISQSFTGTDYATGASAHTKPLPLSTALDLLYTSFGARDFNVLYGGSSITMQSLAAKVGTLFFNVKDPDYGATGDGTTNDLAAIQEAVDAAETAGGGIVFFPKGTYNVGFATAIDLPAGVSLLGVGPGVSILRKSVDAGAAGIVSPSAATHWQTIEGLSFACAAPTARGGVDASVACKILFRNCTFGDATNVMLGISSTDANSEIVATECRFFPGAASAAISGSSRLTAELCEATLPSTFTGVVYAGAPGATSGVRLLHCKFNASAMAAGTGTLFSFSGASTHVNSVVLGCLCDNPAGGTLNVSVGPGINSQGCNTYLEIGNTWGTALTRSALYGDQATGTTHTGSFVMERERSRYYTADDTAAVAISAVLHATATIKRATLDVQTVTLDGPGPAAPLFSLVYYNSNGGGATGTITMAGNVKGLTTFTVNASSFSVYTFKAIHVQTTKFWVLIGSLTNQTP
jgi:hypothetical protein